MQPISFGDLFSRLFSLNKYGYTSTLYGIVATAVLGVFLTGFLYGMTLLLSFAVGMLGALVFNDPSPANDIVYWTGEIISYFFGFIVGVIATFNGVAVIHATVRYFRNENLQSMDVLKEAYKFAYSKNGLLFGLLFFIFNSIASLGFFLCIVPGFLTTAVVYLGAFTAIDQEVPLSTGVGMAWDRVKEEIFTVFFFSVVLTVISSAIVVLTCGIALFIVAAFVTCGFGTLYVSLFQKPFFEELQPAPVAVTTEQDFDE